MILIGRGLDFKSANETKKVRKMNVFSMCSCQGAEENDIISGGNGEGVPPVPIPNTEVKPFSADGT